MGVLLAFVVSNILKLRLMHRKNHFGIWFEIKNHIDCYIIKLLFLEAGTIKCLRRKYCERKNENEP